MVSFAKGVENVGVMLTEMDIQPILVFISSVSVGSESRLSNLTMGELLICSCRPFKLML